MVAYLLQLPLYAYKKQLDDIEKSPMTNEAMNLRNVAFISERSRKKLCNNYKHIKYQF